MLFATLIAAAASIPVGNIPHTDEDVPATAGDSTAAADQTAAETTATTGEPDVDFDPDPSAVV